MKFIVLLALVGAACAAPVSDTAEVSAAKTAFQAAFDKAAAAAEAAPDFDLDGSLSTYSGYLSAVNGKLSPFFTNTFPYGAFGVHAPIVAGAPVVGAPVTYTAAGAPVTYTAAGAPVTYTAAGAPVTYTAAGAPVTYTAAGAPLVAGTHVVGSPLAYSPFGVFGAHVVQVAKPE